MVVRVLSAAVATVLLLLGGPAVATGARSPADLDDLYGELGIAEVATHYVVLVDTSASMQDGGRYDDVRDSLRTFFDGLRAVDQVTLITFDVLPEVVHAGPADQAGDAIDDMPEVADGDSTDIGAALEVALDSLERPGGAPLGAVVLITDGVDNPPPDSDYAREEAWALLAARGKELADHVSGYAIPLTSDESGASVLHDVLPTVVLRMTTSDDLGAFLGRLADRVRRSNAVTMLRPDLTAEVEVEWVPPPAGADLADPVSWTVRVRSRAAHLPLEITNPRVAVTGVDAEVTGLPERLALAPGEDAGLTLTVNAVRTSELRLRHTRTVGTRLRLTGTVDSPWRPVIERDLGLTFAPRPLDSAVEWSGSSTVGYPLLVVAAAAVVIVLLIATPGFTWSRRHPRMHGTLFATAAEGEPLRVDLRGRRRLRFPRPPSPLLPGVSGEFTVRGGTGGDRGSLRVHYRPHGGDPARPQVCAPDTEREIYGITIRYRGRT